MSASITDKLTSDKATIRVMCSDCRNHGGQSAIVNQSEYVIATPGAMMGAKESLKALDAALSGLGMIIFTPHTNCAAEALLLEPELRNSAHDHFSDLVPWCKQEFPEAKLRLEYAVLDGTESKVDLSKAILVKEFSAVDSHGKDSHWKLFGLDITD